MANREERQAAALERIADVMEFFQKIHPEYEAKQNAEADAVAKVEADKKAAALAAQHQKALDDLAKAEAAREEAEAKVAELKSQLPSSEPAVFDPPTDPVVPPPVVTGGPNG
jgi:hypothetical protein